ncbi:MAG: hypothetical protein U9R56_02895 [candidate division Zixibacteria bacterium]|nr:hypothetical protein [candidate division Zixibacteria bacterium]
MANLTTKGVSVLDLRCESNLGTAVTGTDEKTICKFVLVSNNHELYLIFGSVREFPYHANLLDCFCDRYQIPAGWIKDPDMVEIYDPDFAIKGGGWMEIDKSARSLQIYGYSTAYGRFDPKDLDLVLRDDPLFSTYSVKIGA